MVVDDSVIVRRALADLLLKDPQISLVDTASTGHIALKKISLRPPDVVILDVDMPDLDGLATLKAIRLTHPTLPILMFSALTERAADVTLNALFSGANDYITKPYGMSDSSQVAEYISNQLISKIKSVASRLISSPTPSPPPPAPTPSIFPPNPFSSPKTQPRLSPPPPHPSRIDAIVIATSTGGPVALVDLLAPLPANFPIPILIVQHMPPIFTQRLAERLSRTTHLHAQEGRHGAHIRDAQVWIAPGGFHMSLLSHGTTISLALNQDPPENECRPAADVLFRSAASIFQNRLLACVLTGMGRDGTAGCRLIHAAGGTIFAQDRDSAVIWSMPESVISAGLAHKILSTTAMARELCILSKKHINPHLT
jgi:two-component system chemotaxis response regulator CheB